MEFPKSADLIACMVQVMETCALLVMMMHLYIITSAAIVALLIVIVAVRKRRRRTGSYTPEQQRHTSMTLNLSVKRISSTFSYTSKP